MAPTDSPAIPVLILPHPFVLLPGGLINIGLARTQADALGRVVDLSPNPRVAAVPLLPAPDEDDNDEEAGGARLYDWGVLARVTQLVRAPTRRPAPYVATLAGISRIHLPTASQVDPFSAPLLRLPYETVKGSRPTSENIRAFKTAALRLFDRLAHEETLTQRARERWSSLATLVEEATNERIGLLADSLSGMLGMSYKDRLHMLSLEPNQLLKHLTELILKQNTTLGLQLPAGATSKLSTSRNPNEEASSDEFDTSADPENDPDGLNELRKKIEALGPGTEERRIAVSEWKRLKRIPTASAEWGVVRGYIDWIVSIPWPASSQPNKETDSNQLVRQNTRVFLAAARAQLDEDHYGLDKVKRRLVEYLAIVRLLETKESKLQAEEQEQARSKAEAEEVKTQQKNAELALEQDKVSERALVKASSSEEQKPARVPAPRPTPAPARKRITAKGPILLFVGPPGTGKTSLGASIARALGRPFQRIALGGVRDEGEIRGHRRTYVAAAPGLIVQALRRAGRPDPVLLLDEVDKVGGSNHHGDPGAALLEVLDPEQNYAFGDHYLNMPVDLSGVLFLCTANTLDTIPGPLRDRCEIVHVAGYTATEKAVIARRFLVPRQIRRCGLGEGDVKIGDDVLEKVVGGYTREAGVRGLERAIAGVVRWKAVEWSESQNDGAVEGSSSEQQGNVDAAVARAYQKDVRAEDLENILGVARWNEDEREREARPGVVYGLVVTGMGEGEVMPVETITVPGNGRLKLTGSLGDVIKESGEIALSWVKSHATDLGLPVNPLAVRGVDVHLHLPAGAQKKDGPSAGVAITCAFVSLLTGASVPADTAMTGEVTLRGRVTPVGGIKEKVLGAHRAGCTRVLLPYANRQDVAHDVPSEVKSAMEFVFVRTLEEALQAAFGPSVLGGWSKLGRDQVEEGAVLTRL